MAFKPNYSQQRAERNRSKEQKKREKLQRREGEAATEDDPKVDVSDSAGGASDG